MTRKTRTTQWVKKDCIVCGKVFPAVSDIKDKCKECVTKERLQSAKKKKQQEYQNARRKKALEKLRAEEALFKGVEATHHCHSCKTKLKRIGRSAFADCPKCDNVVQIAKVTDATSITRKETQYNHGRRLIIDMMLGHR